MFGINLAESEGIGVMPTADSCHACCPSSGGVGLDIEKQEEKTFDCELVLE